MGFGSDSQDVLEQNQPTTMDQHHNDRHKQRQAERGPATVTRAHSRWGSAVCRSGWEKQPLDMKEAVGKESMTRQNIDMQDQRLNREGTLVKTYQRNLPNGTRRPHLF